VAVAKALVNKAAALAELGRSDEAVGVCGEVVGRYGDREELSLAKQVARALVNKGVVLGAMGRSAAEIGIYDEVVSRYGARDEVPLAEQVAWALVNKGVRLGALDRSEAAVGVYDEVVSRYGGREDLSLAEQVAKARLASILVSTADGTESRTAPLREFIEAHDGSDSASICTLVDLARRLLEDEGGRES
jgi:tetratricopeptide (TPR) repeat protein